MFRSRPSARETAGRDIPAGYLPATERRYDQDELRHLLATAGAMSWGITSGLRLGVDLAGQRGADCPTAA